MGRSARTATPADFPVEQGDERRLDDDERDGEELFEQFHDFTGRHHCPECGRP